MFGWRCLTSFLPRPHCVSALLHFLLTLSDNTIMQRLAASALVASRRVALTNARVNLRTVTPRVRHNSSAANKDDPQDVKPFVRAIPQDWAAPVVTYEEVKKRTMDPPPVRSPTQGTSLI